MWRQLAARNRTELAASEREFLCALTGWQIWHLRWLILIVIKGASTKLISNLIESFQVLILFGPNFTSSNELISHSNSHVTPKATFQKIMEKLIANTTICVTTATDGDDLTIIGCILIHHTSLEIIMGNMRVGGRFPPNFIVPRNEWNVCGAWLSYICRQLHVCVENFSMKLIRIKLVLLSADTGIVSAPSSSSLGYTLHYAPGDYITICNVSCTCKLILAERTWNVLIVLWNTRMAGICYCFLKRK